VVGISGWATQLLYSQLLSPGKAQLPATLNHAPDFRCILFDAIAGLVRLDQSTGSVPGNLVPPGSRA